MRLLIKTRFVCLINIILDRDIFPELLQKQCNPQSIAEAMIHMEQQASSIQNDLEHAFSSLKPHDSRSPSEIEADVILSLLA